MLNKQFSSASYADSKPHYNILDGLRGAAALMVVWYHVFEGFAFAEGIVEPISLYEPIYSDNGDSIFVMDN